MSRKHYLVNQITGSAKQKIKFNRRYHAGNRFYDWIRNFHRKRRHCTKSWKRWMVVAWLIAGLMTIMAALSYGELASLIPNAGGQYVYLREAYNPLVAFLYGWSLFAVIQTGTIAAVGVAFAKFTGVFVPELSEKNILLQIGTFKLSAAQLLAIASIVFLTWYNTYLV